MASTLSIPIQIETTPTHNKALAMAAQIALLLTNQSIIHKIIRLHRQTHSTVVHRCQSFREGWPAGFFGKPPFAELGRRQRQPVKSNDKGLFLEASLFRRISIPQPSPRHWEAHDYQLEWIFLQPSFLGFYCFLNEAQYKKLVLFQDIAHPQKKNERHFLRLPSLSSSSSLYCDQVWPHFPLSLQCHIVVFQLGLALTKNSLSHRITTNPSACGLHSVKGVQYISFAGCGRLRSVEHTHTPTHSLLPLIPHIACHRVPLWHRNPFLKILINVQVLIMFLRGPFLRWSDSHSDCVGCCHTSLLQWTVGKSSKGNR